MTPVGPLRSSASVSIKRSPPLTKLKLPLLINMVGPSIMVLLVELTIMLLLVNVPPPIKVPEAHVTVALPLKSKLAESPLLIRVLLRITKSPSKVPVSVPVSVISLSNSNTPSVSTLYVPSMST